jgi:hypothetical protein
LIEQPATPIEQPEVEGAARRSAPATPGLLALGDEAAVPTLSTKSAKPTVPLLAGLLIIAVFVSTRSSRRSCWRACSATDRKT